MTNRLALVLFLAILGGIAFDLFRYDGMHLAALLDRYDQFLEYLAFWR